MRVASLSSSVKGYILGLFPLAKCRLHQAWPFFYTPELGRHQQDLVTQGLARGVPKL